MAYLSFFHFADRVRVDSPAQTRDDRIVADCNRSYVVPPHDVNVRDWLLSAFRKASLGVSGPACAARRASAATAPLISAWEDSCQF
jgi:hypothetical protein